MWGVQDGGEHAIDVDIFHAQFSGHGFGDAQHLALGRDISTHSGQAALRGVRTDVHYLAPALAQHLGHYGAAGVAQGNHIHVVQKIPGAVAGFMHHIAHGKSTGEVTQHIDAAKA